ncbi:ABC transporter permease [Salinarimonas ramus]|uniref:Spermidine/putrescine ABC transporter permease n=1 Tax=Salinarimonas ramus TaxID=690164 RepID=A0A917QEH6_9HYPH|nr:ABC transporter permease [Salinarimonas ramus]GGK46799.1 spermidine/putrescine ABC transporter permease [Salinarimonas ramus]
MASLDPRKAGPLAMAPVAALLVVGFLVPLVLVAWLSLMPERTFGLDAGLTLANYATAFEDGYIVPLGWSLFFAAATTAICLLVAWPMAKTLARRGSAFALVVTILVALPIFVSESVRLFGTALFLMPRGGILAGSLNALFGFQVGSILYTKTATLLGLVYVYLPFALFPMILGLSQVPRDQVEAARDLGASRWQVLREVELPNAMPGLLIGGLLVFVLAFGANTEANILGGQSVAVITKSIDQRFSYAQDWPLGSALTILVCAITAAVVFPVLERIDLDRLLRR